MKKTALIIIFTLVFFVKPVAAQAASLALSPASAAKKVGDIFAVDVVLDTGSDAVSGATAILHYDATRLQVQDDDVNSAGLQIAKGAIFNQTPLTNTVDTVKGEIRFDSGSLGSSYTGHGTMATVHFKAVAVGTAPVTFVFNSNSTTDTSLVAAASGPTNLLTTVTDGTYSIAAATTTTTTTTTTPAPILYAAGATENTILATLGGLLFLVIGGFLWTKQSCTYR